MPRCLLEIVFCCFLNETFDVNKFTHSRYELAVLFLLPVCIYVQVKLVLAFLISGGYNVCKSRVLFVQRLGISYYEFISSKKIESQATIAH